MEVSTINVLVRKDLCDGSMPTCFDRICATKHLTEGNAFVYNQASVSRDIKPLLIGTKLMLGRLAWQQVLLTAFVDDPLPTQSQVSGAQFPWCSPSAPNSSRRAFEAS